MTTMEKMLLFGSMGAGALNSAVGARQNNQNQAQNELDAMVQRQLNALQNKQQTSQNLQDQRQQGWKDQTSQSPLGQEQSFLQKQRLAQVLFPQIANFKPAMPTDPGVAGAYVPQTNILSAIGNPKFLETFSDQATATSLADRRKLMAGLNPDYEFSSLGNFGLDSSFDEGVNRAQNDAAARRQAYESTQTSLANQQHELAGQAAQSGQQQEKKGGGVKGFLGGLLKTAAPFASFIPGVGPIAAIGLGAAGGALGNKMQGGGLVSGALQGGVGAGIGAAGKSLASGQGLNPFNNGAGRALSNAMTPASLPIGNMVSQPTSVGLPSSGFDLTQLVKGGLQGNNPAQSVAPSGGSRPSGPAPNMGQQPGSVTKGFNPQGYPLKNAGPYTGPGSTSAQIGPLPSGTVAGEDFMAQLQAQPLVKALNSPMGMIMAGAVGASRPGPAPMGPIQGQLGPGPQMPQLGPGPQPKFVGSGATPQALAAGRPPAQLGPGPQPKMLGSGQYNVGPAGSTSMPQGGTFNLPARSGSTIENEMNAKRIMDLFSRMQMSQSENAAANISPEVQAIFQQLLTAPKLPAGMRPDQLMQMIIRGGG